MSALSAVLELGTFAVVAVHISHKVCAKSCPIQLSSICQSPFDGFCGLDANATLYFNLLHCHMLGKEAIGMTLIQHPKKMQSSN